MYNKLAEEYIRWTKINTITIQVTSILKAFNEKNKDPFTLIGYIDSILSNCLIPLNDHPKELLVITQMVIHPELFIKNADENFKNELVSEIYSLLDNYKNQLITEEQNVFSSTAIPSL